MWLVSAMPAAVVNTLVGAFFGSLMATGIVAFLTQKWIENRERRNRRHDLRLELYLDVVDLVLDNELALASCGTKGEIPPIELQTKRYGISHRLRLLGSNEIYDAYRDYSLLVFQSTAHDLKDRPKNPNDVITARDWLLDLMARDVQGTSEHSWFR